MKYKKIYCVAFSLFFTIFIFISYCHASEDIKWHSYKEGIALGKSEEKKVFIHFWAKWCTYCVKMKKGTFADPLVADYLNKNFIPVMIEVDKERKITDEYKVRGLPNNWFVTEKGERIANRPGFIPPGKFLVLLKYISTDSYKKMDLKKFSESCSNL